jgi:azurin
MKRIRSIALTCATLALSGAALAQDCEVTIDSTDKMTFDKDEIVVSSDCEEITLTLNHVGQLPEQAMGHNWVLSRTEDAQGVVSDGIAAGLDNEYLKPDDPRVLAATDIIGGGESTTITFGIGDLDPDADYQFFCTFPGHYGLMKGEFRIE